MDIIFVRGGCFENDTVDDAYYLGGSSETC